MKADIFKLSFHTGEMRCVGGRALIFVNGIEQETLEQEIVLR